MFERVLATPLVLVLIPVSHNIPYQFYQLLDLPLSVKNNALDNDILHSSLLKFFY